ncbi:uncharacterized protein LOC135497247 [Lineus longissimus]|uniref:uncharacterized protein LOC135497247 n=1 Tax=Lineus longissimus TaxID=88925 RepID=UPI00315C538B
MAAWETDTIFVFVIDACTKYVWIFLIIFGIPGNILALVISLQKSNRTNAACLYMAAIAAADFLVLVNFTVCQSTMFWIVKESLGEVPLQLCWYSAYTFGPISGLCLALMSIDRVIAVRFPLRAARLCTTGRAKRAVVITYTAIMTVNLHIFVFYKKDAYSQGVMEQSASTSLSDTAITARWENDTIFMFVIEACTKYVWIFLIIFGIPGNILALVISLQKSNRTSAACIYMAAIAAADFLVLVNFVVCHSASFWIVKESLGEVPLQLCWYSAYTFGPISGLCLALMSIDRVIAVRFPLRAARLCTTGRAKRSVVITYTAIMTVNLHIFVVYKKDALSKTSHS